MAVSTGRVEVPSGDSFPNHPRDSWVWQLQDLKAKTADPGCPQACPQACPALGVRDPPHTQFAWEVRSRGHPAKQCPLGQNSRRTTKQASALPAFPGVGQSPRVGQFPYQGLRAVPLGSSCRSHQPPPVREAWAGRERGRDQAGPLPKGCRLKTNISLCGGFKGLGGAQAATRDSQTCPG